MGSILNPGVQNLKGTLPWCFSISHCPSKWTRGPDALSRYPGHASTALAIIREHPSDTDNNLSISTNEAVQVAGIYAVNEIGNIIFDHILTAASADAQYQDLLHIITIGFPKRYNATEPAYFWEFWEVRHRLSVFDGVALLDQRLVILHSLRSVILNNLHSANQSVTGMRFRANQCVYWPGLDSSIRNHQTTCRDCIRNAPSQPPEPLILTPLPTYPFEQVCADYFHIGHFSYLTIVDRFSGWISIYSFKANEVNSAILQNIFRDLFVAYGASEDFSSEGGPQFMSKGFQDFLKVWGVKHRLSSVAFPQSNGRVEVAVKAVKRIIHNNISPDSSLDYDKAARGILQYRNTPLLNINLSPAQVLLHRQLRDSIPAHPAHYRPHKEWVLTAEEREKRLSKRNLILIQKHDAKAHELTPLTLGTNVVVQGKDKKWDRTARIVEVLPNRQYHIRMFHSGRVTLRNRRYLREYTATTPEVHQPIPSASLPGSTPSATTEYDTPNLHVPSRPPQINIDPDSLQEELPVATTGNIRLPSPPTTTKTVQRVPRVLTNLFDYNKPGLKEFSGPVEGRRPMGRRR